MDRYATATDAKSAIRTAIDAGDATSADFDIDAICAATHDWADGAFVQTATVEEFWSAVQENEL